MLDYKIVTEIVIMIIIKKDHWKLPISQVCWLGEFSIRFYFNIVSEIQIL